MTESFLTQYRPTTIADFQLDPTMENALYSFLEMDDLNLLLYGNPSCGKSILMETIVREYYQLKKGDVFPEYNLMVINNLKEQGIQYYRQEMKSFCQSRCTLAGKKKIILIDDLDNMNEQSQQVFRNYMDKYRDNIHVVAVCTNLQKVIESLQSRMHIMQIHHLSLEKIKNVMTSILEKEQFNIPKDCQDYLLSICNHSVRTVINHIEKLYILDQPVTLDLCKSVCSNISFQHFDLYLDAIRDKQLIEAIRILYDLYYSGYSVIDVLDYFFLFVKNTDRLDETTKYQIIPILCKYITVFYNVHEDVIELALFTNYIIQQNYTLVK